MNEKNVIAFLKSQQIIPESSAVERCIAALPTPRGRSILPLIRLQMLSLPGEMYGIGLCLIAVQQRLLTTMTHSDALVASGVIGSLIAFWLAWHLTMAGTEGMAEIEGCCRYSYGQILLSRILCLCILTCAAIVFAAIPGAIRHEIGTRFILLSLMPTGMGALAAILWANYRGNQDGALIAVYLVTSTLVSLNLNRILVWHRFLSVGVFLGILMILSSQTKILIARSMNHEAYHY